MICDCRIKKHYENCIYRKRDILAEKVNRLEMDIFTLVLRLMGEDKSTHAPETLEVLDRWEPIVAAKLEHI